ncbi:MAG: hypothetical protein JNM88_00180 [Chitinophagaceae bacterium]|nr:hypothetical protein [Chitinophagaceae bacterium]
MKKVTSLLPFFFLMVTISITSAQPTIVTSQGTFEFKAPEECINSNCLAGVKVVTEMAGKALSADIAKAAGEATALNKELKTMAGDYDSMKTEFMAAKAPYDAKLDAYTADLAGYTRDVDRHNGEVAANNARKPEDRSAAEVSRLNQNKAALDVRKSGLDDRKQGLDTERAPLMTKWNNLEAKRGVLLQKQSAARSIADKLNKALEQLKLCEEYGNRALEVAKEKNWGTYKTVGDFFGTLKIIPSKELLNGNLEKMKNWADKNW